MIIAEPVQNAGGCFTPPAGYWPGLRELADRYGILLVADEVISGFGRLGEWFGVDALRRRARRRSRWPRGSRRRTRRWARCCVSDRVVGPLLASPAHAAARRHVRRPPGRARRWRCKTSRSSSARACSRTSARRAVPRPSGWRGCASCRSSATCAATGFFWAVELVPTRTARRFDRRSASALLRGFLPRPLLEAGLIARARRPRRRGRADRAAADRRRRVLDEIVGALGGVLEDAAAHMGVGCARRSPSSGCAPAHAAPRGAARGGPVARCSAGRRPSRASSGSTRRRAATPLAPLEGAAAGRPGDRRRRLHRPLGGAAREGGATRRATSCCSRRDASAAAPAGATAASVDASLTHGDRQRARAASRTRCERSSALGRENFDGAARRTLRPARHRLRARAAPGDAARRPRAARGRRGSSEEVELLRAARRRGRAARRRARCGRRSTSPTYRGGAVGSAPARALVDPGAARARGLRRGGARGAGVRVHERARARRGLRGDGAAVRSCSRAAARADARAGAARHQRLPAAACARCAATSCRSTTTCWSTEPLDRRAARGDRLARPAGRQRRAATASTTTG